MTGEKKDEKTTKPMIGTPKDPPKEDGPEVEIFHFHMDPEVEEALINLNDRICTWERSTGRGYTLALVPHQKEEKVHLSIDGKPVSEFTEKTPEKQVIPTITHALRLRR